MKVIKFGGTSVGTPQRVLNVVDIIEDIRREDNNLAVVISAFGGVTDKLIEMSHQASRGDENYKTLYKSVVAHHQEFLDILLPENQDAARDYLSQRFQELKEVLQGVFWLKEISSRTLDFIMSFGERFSCFIISQILQAKGIPANFLDTRQCVKTDHCFGYANVQFNITLPKIREYFAARPASELQIATGFIASTDDNQTTTLGRSGSDYTASIIAAALEASEIEIWTDVDGVMTTDPRKVSQAFSIHSLSYEEAMEMSHFGAKVIHPPTMHPALTHDIPIRIRNTFNRRFPGTLISHQVTPSKYLVKGITSISEIAMIQIQGTGMIGVVSTPMRIFGALAQENINIILITQASSEHSLCIAVVPQDAEKAKRILEKEFTLEIQTQRLDTPIIEYNMTVIAVVGANMRKTPGIAGRFFQSLGKNGINVIAIAQGSSELNISIIISKHDESKALNVLHESFFLSDTRLLNLFIVGLGLVGSTLLRQIKEHLHFLLQENALEIKLVGMANRRKMHFDINGISLENWKEALTNSEEASDIKNFIQRIKTLNLPNSIFVDCTDSADLPSCYAALLKTNISIVSPNKKACSSNYKLYQNLKQLSQKRGAKFLYETNVGAGLPVLSTLNDLKKSGDKILKIEAVLSGTLSYIFNTFTGKKSFSEIVKQAKEYGYTEPDPREDLNGLDVARKLLILARDSGLPLEKENISLENLIPESCQNAPTAEIFLDELKKTDPYFESLRKKAAADGKKLRYIATLENNKAWISLQAVDAGHPFYSLSGNDNIIAFTSERYEKCPLVIKGPGAGAEVTAAGVFADIIRLSTL